MNASGSPESSKTPFDVHPMDHHSDD
ncbi:hypothetical protein PLANTIT3_50226 [Plantibacter sp. T3]|nr:hypothetical protein PLANTIT3_50226 [Plantibacter sp. T3]